MTADRSISYWKGLEKGCFSSFFFFFKFPLLSALRCSLGQVFALRVEKLSCRCYMRLSSAFFFLSVLSKKLPTTYNAPLAIRYPPDIRPRPLPGLIFSNIRPRSVTNWISTCGLNRFATCSLRSAECHRVKPTANLVCVISEVTGAQLVAAAQHTLWRVGSL